MQLLQLAEIMGKKKKGGLLWLENYSCLAKLFMSNLPSEAQYSFREKYQFQALPSSVSASLLLEELSPGCQLQELVQVHLQKRSFIRRGGS